MDQRRYKQRGLQFNSTSDSRALRAVKYQEGWKAQRNNAITNRRQLENFNDSVDSIRPNNNQSIIKQDNLEEKVKKTKKELGIERYKQLLKWKENKKKTLDKEKRRRLPSFKTGIYHPETPKFLVSSDGNVETSVSETPSKKTPFKFLVSSTKKSSITPSTSGTIVRRKIPVFHTGVTPGTSVQKIPKRSTGVTPSTSVPRFRTGVTPNDMLKMGGILRHDSFCKNKSLTLQKDQECKVASTRAGLRTARPEYSKQDKMPLSSRYRSTRLKKANDQEELGVKPLPATPKPNQALITKRCKRNDSLLPSFAPSDFTFKFEASNKRSFGNGSSDGGAFEEEDKFCDGQSEAHLRNEAAEKIGIERDKSAEMDSAHMADDAAGLRQEDAGVAPEAHEQEKDSGVEEDQEEVDQCEGQISEAEEQAEEGEAEEQAEEGEAEEQAEEGDAEEQAEEGDAEEQAEEGNAEEQAEEGEAEEQAEEGEAEEQAEEGDAEEQAEEGEAEEQAEEGEAEEQAKEGEAEEQVEEGEAGEPAEESKAFTEVEMMKVEELESEESVEEIKADEQLLDEKIESDVSDGVQVTAGNSDQIPYVMKGEINTMDVGEKMALDDEPDGAARECKATPFTNDKVGKASKRSSVATPRNRYTRKSVACCGDGILTPSLSRLRPRTPCSRNTRRSLSAHCDPQPEFTPSRRTPGRKSYRHSMNSAKIIPELSSDVESTVLKNIVKEHEPVIENEQMHEAAAVESRKQFKMPDGESISSEKKVQITPKADKVSSSSLLITPKSLERQSKVSWKIETSPWIDVSRRTKKRRSCSTPDFQKFPEVPTDGSPLPVHLIPEAPTYKICESAMVSSDKKTDSAVSDDQPCVELLALLKPSLLATAVDSPAINVWGEATPVTKKSDVLVTSEVNMEHHSQTTPGSSCATMHSLTPAIDQSTDQAPLSSIMSIPVEVASSTDSPKSRKSGAEKVPDQSLPSNSSTVGKVLTGKRKSRRSVMFAVDQENEVPSFRFPGTPIRSSSRASMGLFGNVDMSTDDIIPSRHEDQCLVESPKSEKKTTATRRKSSRVSLLPGMTRSPLVEQTLPVNCDLISWDTPVETKERISRRSIASKFATPSRRSKRLSRAQVL
ncbi:microtubule-associated protein 1B isoform X1 [Procambarus clarkii]|uniref:microtubule-associated protein 1B isoform X1 n=1 Tax=Procambarus clarkii TaxID=6728 RepID=UPI0037423FE0